MNMRFINLVPSIQIGVMPVIIKGFESHGLIYLTWEDSPVVGGQCSVCNTILWVNQRGDEILSESKPLDVPESGLGFQSYYRDKIQRFLKSLPGCPSCKSEKFDRFINNVNYPRFIDGLAFPENASGRDVVPVDSEQEKVWLWGDLK